MLDRPPNKPDDPGPEPAASAGQTGWPESAAAQAAHAAQAQELIPYRGSECRYFPWWHSLRP